MHSGPTTGSIKGKSIHTDITIVIKTLADLWGAIICGPFRNKFPYFHTVFGKFLPNDGLAPPPSGSPPPPPRGKNPGFTPEKDANSRVTIITFTRASFLIIVVNKRLFFFAARLVSELFPTSLLFIVDSDHVTR